MSEFLTGPGTVVLENLGLEINSVRRAKVRTPFDPKPRSDDNVIEVWGKRGSDVIDASKGRFNYILKGGAGGSRDTLVGGKKSDVIEGDRGADSLAGGAGQDSFVFNKRDIPTEGDSILDFEAKDTILLARSILDKKLQSGKLSRKELAIVKRNSGKTATRIDETLIYEQKTGNIYYNDRKNANDTQLITLENSPDEISNKNFEIF